MEFSKNFSNQSDVNYYQDIARHSFCDMVNDFDRNNKYAGAIERVVQAARDRDGYVYVFDVGCGSGLLSMLALKFGADYVFAVEQNKEIAKTAQRILEQNNFDENIEILITRLEDVKRSDLKRTFLNKEIAFPNVVTAELFDSEMIGEDALRIYQAIKPLVCTNAFFVPTSGRIYIQIVNSPFFSRCHVISKTIEIMGRKVEAPVEVRACSGTSEIQDLHLDRFSDECSKDILSDPIEVFEFDFTSINSKIINESKRFYLQLKRPISSNDKLCIIFWWSSRMDIFSTSELTTAPHWILNVAERWSPWREHWLPIIYHFPIKQYEHFLYKHHKLDKIELFCNHDEYQFQFSLINLKEKYDNVQDKIEFDETIESKMELFDYDCVCEIHRTLGRLGMFQFNNQKRFTDWLHNFNIFLDQLQRRESISVLFLSDFSPLPFLIAQDKRIKKIYVDVSGLDGQQKLKFYRKLMKTNSTSKIVFYSNGPIHFDVLAIDEFITTRSILFERFSNDILDLISQESFDSYPEYFNVHLNYFLFEKLYKNYCNVKETQEFNFQEYDELIMSSRGIADVLPELVNCSEYRSSMCSQPIKDILKITPTQLITKEFGCSIRLHLPEEIYRHDFRKSCACVLWLSLQNGKKSFSYNSPVISENNFCEWPPFTNQFVQFFDQIPGVEYIKYSLEIDEQRLRIVWNNENNKIDLFINK